MIVPDVARIITPVGVDATAEGVLPTPLYPVKPICAKFVREPAPSRMRITSVSLDVKVVVDAMDMLPPTRYVPAGSVGEVAMVVAPLPTDTVVTVFTRTGGTGASTAVGATT
jgi:hypothetical protein